MVFALSRYCKISERTAQNVARVKEFKSYVGGNVHFAVVTECNYLVGRLYTVCFAEQRLPGKFFTFFGGLFCKEFSIAGLYSCAVHHYDVCKIACSRCCINIAVIFVFCKNRKKSTVVKMSVGQYNAFYFVCCKIKVSVFFVCLGTFSLKSPAVNHKASSVYFKNVFASGNFLCRTQRITSNAHIFLLIINIFFKIFSSGQSAKQTVSY